MVISKYHGSLLKRFVDVILASLALPLIGMIFIFLWIIHFATDKDSVFYIKNRVGFLGEEFKVYKFRSISESDKAEKWQLKFLSGMYRLMRACHIDEFPQFLNVIKGDMSVIGPRPYLSKECLNIMQRVPEFNKRHFIKPGITGLAQTNYRHENTEEVSIAKFNDDILYARDATLIIDMKILLITVIHIIRMRGI